MVVISYVEVDDMEAIQFIIAYKTGRLKITDENYFTAYTKVLFQFVIYQFDNNMYIMKCETSRRYNFTLLWWIILVRISLCVN